jgi:CRP-like cAMP-binding protein/Zn-dependent protease
LSTEVTGIYGAIESRPRSRRRGAGPSGLWRRLAAGADPSRFRPRLAADIELKEFRLRWGNDYAMLANPRDLIHYRLETDEVELVRLMDGTRSVKEIVLERLREGGELDLDAVVELVRQLQEGGFLDPPYVDVEAAVRRAMQPSVARQKAREFVRTLSIDWAGAERLVVWLYRHGVRCFFNPVAVVLGSLVGVAGLVAFVALVRGGRFSLSGQSLALEFLILFILNYALTFLHELGHAAVLVHYGRRVKSAGFMVYFGSPAFFVEASDVLMLDRRQRIVQAWAGPFAELMVAGVASIAALLFPDAAISSVLYKFAVLNYFVLSMNLVPLLELDGYFILSDLIQVPDLRPRSLGFLRYDLVPKALRRERWRPQEVGLALYAILGILFAAFSFYEGFYFWESIFGSLIARMWDGGLVTRVMLIALGLLVTGPIVRGALNLARSIGRRLRAAWRAVRFRLEQSWRVEAARMIDRLPLFEDVPVDVLNDLAGRVRLRTAPRGAPVFRQGDRADAFYVVRRGTLQVVEEDPESGEERSLSTLGPGESFGELGLLEQAPRAATVRALEESQLFEIGKGTFDQLLADMAGVPDFGPTLQAAAELRRLPCFSVLDPAAIAELLEEGRWITVPPGETVIEEGEVGDAFYAIGSGQVEVLRRGRRVRTVGPGAFFGEVALLEDVPRTATVRAISAVRVFRLDRQGFDRLVGDAFRRGTLNPHAAVDREQRH